MVNTCCRDLKAFGDLIFIFRTLIIEAFVSSGILFLEGMLSEDFSVLFGKLCEKLHILFTLDLLPKYHTCNT